MHVCRYAHFACYLAGRLGVCGTGSPPTAPQSKRILRCQAGPRPPEGGSVTLSRRGARMDRKESNCIVLALSLRYLRPPFPLAGFFFPPGFLAPVDRVYPSPVA